MSRAIKILLSILAIITVGVVVYVYFGNKPKFYTVSLGKDGYQPNLLRIRKGDYVKFSTTLNSDYWPASDPHPTHSLYPEFDPKHILKNYDVWTFRFGRAGTWAYHDHIDPSARGTVIVSETNPLDAPTSGIVSFYKHNIQKRDVNFIKKSATDCIQASTDRSIFLTCWQNFFSGITNDFGVTEAMRLLGLVSLNGMIDREDCHLMADQIGTDAYWQLVSGHKFAFTKDFAMCDFGFFHHFMSEHVSHGQDLASSMHLCDSLDPSLTKQCYFGMGNGLAYYYWNILGNNADGIVRQSIKRCTQDIPTIEKDTCVLGVLSGIDHLFEGQHGSNLQIDINNPYALCTWMEKQEYKDSCYERMIPSLNYALGSDVMQNSKKLVYWLGKIPTLAARNFATRRFGIMLSEKESAKPTPDFSIPLNICRSLDKSFEPDCSWGVYYNIFSNAAVPGNRLEAFRCSNIMFIKPEENGICLDAQFSAGITK